MVQSYAIAQLLDGVLWRVPGVSVKKASRSTSSERFFLSASTLSCNVQELDGLRAHLE